MTVFQCSKPSPENSRKLVVCIDGTSNQFGVTNTNIVELYSHITKSDAQLTYYSSGLGTVAQVAGPSLYNKISNAWDMAFGRNLHKVIMASYRWLSNNYRDGDSLFLFGFSRGAYQVRALAGMIAQVGLLLPGNNEQIPFAFELYSKMEDDDLSSPRRDTIINPSKPTKSKEKREYAQLAETFQRTFCRKDVHIHFVGVWDTVSSVGLDRNKTLPCTTSSCDHICYFRHALALDERRVKFLPEYVYGGRSSVVDGERVKEVWFAGTHGDVGGGNRRNEKLQSGDIPLLWMRSQAVAAGLKMEPGDVIWKIDDLNKKVTNSIPILWWPLELFLFKRLLYYNSDRRTSRPHFGGPRRIVPGQKVHVSVLFKNNYKPYARFYDIPEMWPEPMFWNDAASHQRLQELPDLWEKDIFDKFSIRTLLDHLKPGQPIREVLDRLAFMSSFDECKEAISACEDAKEILSKFLNNKDKVTQLSTAATYCELEWEWPSEAHKELARQITDGVAELLDGRECRQACIYLPSLCKRAELRSELVKNENNLKKLVKLCDHARVDRHEEETNSVPFHSAQALSMLVKLDAEVVQKLVDMEAVTDITEALRSNCSPTLVSLLNVVEGLARHQRGRVPMKAGWGPVPTVLMLVKQFDDFVTPAAIRVLCCFLPDDDLRGRMLRCDVLPTLFDVLDRCSDETKRVACDALIEFVKHGDVQRVLVSDGWLTKFAKRAKHEVPTKCDSSILALATLGNTEVRTAVREAIDAEKTIPVLLARLVRKSSALSAASALARLVNIDDAATVVVVENKDVALPSIIGMLRRRWFDGLRGEDGLQVLSRLLECELLRTAILSSGAVGELNDMIKSKQHESVYAGLHYLRVFIKFDKGAGTLEDRDAWGVIPHVVGALCVPHRRVQRIAAEILRSFSEKESLCTLVVQGVLDLLRDPDAGVILAASTMLRQLSVDKTVRDMVRAEDRFWNMSCQYYEGLEDLRYGESGEGPDKNEVYNSVGRMIQLMQADSNGASLGPEERRWMTPVPYELKKMNRPGGQSITMLVCCPPLLFCGVGRRTYQELWKEG